MTKQASITYISGLMENPSNLTDGDKGSISSYRQSYPYFVPARYLDALEKHKTAHFSPAMLSGIQPYIGDWILFCDFLEAGTGNGYKAGNIPHREKTEVNTSSDASAVNVTLGTTSIEDNSNDLDEVALSEVVEQKIEQVPDEEVIKEQIIESAIVDTALAPEEAVHWYDKIDTAGLVVENINDNPITTEHITNTFVENDEQTLVEIVTPEILEERANNFWIQSDENIADDIAEEEFEDEVTQLENQSSSNTAETEPEIPRVVKGKTEKPLISSIYTEDYFLQQGEKVPTELPEEIESLKPTETAEDAAKSLMVMMSFSEWLLHFKQTAEKQTEESKDQKALKTMWQKEKLAAAIEEENEEIPENVFEMAVNSITKEDGLASESLAEIYIKQGKHEKAIDMYRKLSLRNPQKNAYFALKIEEILKDKEV